MDGETIDPRLVNQIVLADVEAELLTHVGQLLERGASPFAITKLEAALHPHPGFMRARLLLAQLLLGESDFDGAAEQATLAIGLGMHERAAHDVLAEAELGRNEPDRAVTAIFDGLKTLGPDNHSLRRHAHLMIQMRHFSQAASLLENVIDEFPEDISDIYNLAFANEHSGRRERALELAEVCHARCPEIGAYGDYLAHLLSLHERHDDAIMIIKDMIAREPQVAVRYRVLSGRLLVTGRLREALSEAVCAIRLDGTQPEYWLNAGNIAAQLGFKDHALEFLRKAAELAPSDAAVHFNLGHHLYQQKFLDEALEAVTVAIRLAPTQAHYRDFRISMLELRRAEAVRPASEVAFSLVKPLPKALGARPTLGPNAPLTPLTTALRTQLRVIWALTLREIRLRDARSKLGILTVIVEPVTHILALWVVMSVMVHGRPQLGEHWFFLYATGIIPFLLISHLGAHGIAGRDAHRHLLDVPIINEFDLFVAAALGELIIGVVVAFLIFSALWFAGAYHAINSPGTIVMAYLAIWLFGSGLMVVNHALSGIWPVWSRAWYTIQRLGYFTSGIFYMAQHMPGFVRDVLVWNPILIGIEWFRSGFFEQYQPPWLQPGYMLTVAFGTVVAGFMLEHAFRRRVH